MFRSIIVSLANLLPNFPVFAHCDVPCGIYDPKPAQIAAATVKKMVEKITDLNKKGEMNSSAVNSIVRFVWTKEEHARKCKEELLILWTDYFKPEHIKTFPDLHETFWNAAKLCSKNKQEVSMEAADSLVSAVDEIAHIFEQSKKVSA